MLLPLEGCGGRVNFYDSMDYETKGISTAWSSNFTENVASPKLLELLISLAICTLPDMLMILAGSLEPTFGIHGIVTTSLPLIVSCTI
jgi:hypothetical protein